MISICLENAEFSPLINGQQAINKEQPGPLIELIQQTAVQADINIEFSRIPWGRCLSYVDKGKINALLPSAKTNVRATKYQFPSNKEQFLVLAPYHIFYNSSDLNRAFYEDLTTTKDKSTLPVPYLKYGLTASFGYVVNDLLADLNLLAIHNYEAKVGLKMVANKKLDGYVVMKKLGEHKLTSLGLVERVKVTREPLMEERLYIAFNKDFYKDNKALVDKFWRQLQLVRTEKLGY